MVGSSNSNYDAWQGKAQVIHSVNERMMTILIIAMVMITIMIIVIRRASKR
jgi:hypothetical protein